LGIGLAEGSGGAALGIGLAEGSGGAAFGEKEKDVASLRLRTKAYYGLGEAVAGTAQTAVDTFLLFYLTAVVGLSGTLAGAAMFIALLVDGIADPLIGYASDNTRSPHGRRHPFMLAGIVPLALGVGLIFSTPGFDAAWAQFAYVTAVLLMLRIATSFYALPYIALGAELTQDYRERSVIQAYRSFFWILAYAATMYLGLRVFLGGADGLTHRPAYAGLGWTAAAIVAIVGLTAALGTYRVRPPVPPSQRRDGFAVMRLVSEIRDVLHNPSFLVLFGSVLAFWVAQGVANSLWLHAARYFWKLPPEVMQTIPIVGAVGFAAGIPATAIALRRYEKKTVAVVSIAVISLVQLLPALLRVLDWLPADGIPLYTILYALQFTLGVTAISLGIAFPSMMADAADEHELLFGSRREGLYFAGLTLSAKAASGAGAFVAGIGLDLIGFPSDVTNAAVVIGADVTRELGLIWGPGAGFISLLSVVALIRYRLDEGAHAEVLSALRLRSIPS
jgi:GPH family glycoside/pentoside/hexuronide:cation symporter